MADKIHLPIRGYLYLDEAVEIVSKALGVTVEEPEILGFCLNGKLTASVKFTGRVKGVLLREVDEKDVPVEISKPGTHFFHDNPSWDALDDQAKLVSGVKTLLQIADENPNLHAAIEEGAYKTRPVWNEELGESKRGIRDSRPIELNPVPSRLFDDLDGRSWLKYLWKALCDKDREDQDKLFSLMILVDKGRVLCPVEERGQNQLSIRLSADWGSKGGFHYRKSYMKASSLQIAFMNEDFSHFLRNVLHIKEKVEVEQSSETKALEVLGLFMEAFSKEKGGRFRSGESPNCSGQLIPDSNLRFSSATTGGMPSLNE
ncbi:hypothetical protein NYA30BAC_02286 [Halomonas sp. NYA30]